MYREDGGFMEHWIIKEIEEKERLLRKCKSENYFRAVEQAGSRISAAIKSGHKILIAGNGGSAADAQHFAGEIVGRFLKERAALPAVSLCVDPSVVTSICNDYGYEQLFARQVQGIGNEGDVFIGISTSGYSENILYAMKEAREKGICVIGLLGKDGGKAKELCDIALVIPSDNTARIQEMHTFTVHILCEMTEAQMVRGGGVEENA